MLTYQQVAQVEDSNGNKFDYGAPLNSPFYSDCQNTYCFTDTVGRTIKETGYAGFYIAGMAGESYANEPQTISYIDQNGATQTINIKYSPYTLNIPSLCGNSVTCGPSIGTQASPASVNLPTSIVLQNGDTYTINYLLDSSGETLGEISSITLPTGGVISYTWSGVLGINGGITGRQVLSRTVTVNGQLSTWQYQYPPPYPNSNVTYNGTVTDPNLNDTVYTFGVLNQNTCPSPLLVNQEISYNGSQSANSPIATKTIGYTLYGGYRGSGTYLPASNILTWNSSGETTETDTAYDNPAVTTSCSTVENSTISRGNIVSKIVYDYGSGARGALLSKTQYSYLHNTSTNPAYNTANIADRVSGVSVYNATGALVAQTTTAYDGFSQSAQNGLASPGWTTNHDTSYGTGTTLRGLPTSSTKCSGPSSSPCSASITTYTDYNALGQPTVATDGLGYSTTNTYATASVPTNPVTGLPLDSGPAFLITTTMPTTGTVPHVTTQYQDENTGLSIAKSDQNGNLTEQTYDKLMRPLVTIRPDVYQTVHGTTTNSYPNPNQVITTVVESPSPSKVTTTTLDGMGRKISVSAAADAACSHLTVETAYDLLSRVSAISNPHCDASQPTDGSTQYDYDAIGRLTTKTNPDGTAQTWSFNGNIVNSYDENGNFWTRTYNAESWLTQVKEPNGTTSIGSAPTLETDYAFDTLGNLLRVDQWGGASGSANDHVRQFAYDAAARLIASNNPESASPAVAASQSCAGASGSWTTCYSYDKNSNLRLKTDNRGISINYSYDPLNRLLGKTYNDTTPPVSFTYDKSTITPSANTIGELTQATAQTGSTVLATTSTYNYDPMGRLLNEQQCTPANCGLSTYNNSYGYDLGGKPTSTTFPSNAPTSGSTTPAGQPVTFSYIYDNAERLLTASSSWSDATTHPATLFNASTSSSAPGYGPMGLQNALLGVYASTNASTATLFRAYDDRSRAIFEADSTASAVTGGADSSGSITISGTEASVTKTNTPGTLTLGPFGVGGSLPELHNHNYLGSGADRQ